ncbi:MAG: DNA helicase UvrD, partial [Woeseiaceae bacterium]|nr:DNA helicase UvrD [Woeseiaceae bacterium]NIP22098.1 DNA helicase UvrD [Woeseiaceae bacterium]
PELLSRLRNAGVSYQALEIDRLTDLPEVIDLIALTRALAHRGDREAWLSLLRSPWLGLEWKDICALLMDGRGATVMELLHDEQRLQTMSQRARDSLSTFRETLATHLEQDRNGSLRDRVERLWLALGGPVIAGSSQGVENAYRFLDVIDRLEVGGTLEDV